MRFGNCPFSCGSTSFGPSTTGRANYSSGAARGSIGVCRRRQGRTLTLGEEFGTVTIRRVFENFKIDLQGDDPVVYDEPGDANPALEVWVERPGAASGKRYVFEQVPGHVSPKDPLTMDYRRMVRDYISDLEIVQDGQVVAAKNIEVNHPLHYGGYHFFQHSYGEDKLGVYTVLLVVSDSGLNLVYSGYVPC